LFLLTIVKGQLTLVIPWWNTCTQGSDCPADSLI